MKNVGNMYSPMNKITLKITFQKKKKKNTICLRCLSHGLNPLLATKGANTGR
jgi:hypothetical protein